MAWISLVSPEVDLKHWREPPVDPHLPHLSDETEQESVCQKHACCTLPSNAHSLLGSRVGNSKVKPS